MGTVFDKNWIEEHYDTLCSWQQSAYKSFCSIIADKENTYPCIPGRQGFLMNDLRFSFIGDPREISSVKELAYSLKKYGKCSHHTGKYTSLVVFFHTPKDMLTQYSVEDYRHLFWNILNHVTSFDEQNWPDDIPIDPSHHKWEFCFDGEPYFTFCSTPGHKRRKSRYFPCFLLAFQPRWVFEEINDSTHLGRKMKKAIRKRLIGYDNIPSHPDLKWYGQEDNHEWKQYFLSDDESSLSQCPFTKMKNKWTNLLSNK